MSASDADSEIDCDKLADNLSLTESLSLFAMLANSLALRYSLCATLKDSLSLLEALTEALSAILLEMLVLVDSSMHANTVVL